VRIDEKGWHLGVKEPERRGPFKQAAEAMWSLKKWLVDRAPALARVPHCHAVAFTNCSFPLSSPEWHDWQVIDKPALSRPRATVGAFVRTLLEKHRQTLRENSGFRPIDGIPSDEDVALVRQLLRPEVEFFITPSARSASIEERVRHYTQQQYLTIDRMTRNRKVLVDGPAGSGKTMLALEIVRRASIGGLSRLNVERPRILFVCFNRYLGQALKAATAGLDGVTCATMSQYMLSITGSDVPKAAGAFWRRELPEQAASRLMDHGPAGGLYDVIVMDEAQDLSGEMVLDVLDLSLAGGLKDGCWYAFGDFERQALYSWEDSHDAFGEAFRAKQRLVNELGGFDYLLDVLRHQEQGCTGPPSGSLPDVPRAARVTVNTASASA